MTANEVGELGRYHLIAELARGGMGVVYLAIARGPGGFNKLFVVKVLKDHLADDPTLVSMFLEEARLAAKLSHPNVVQTMEVASDSGRHYIAMEFLDGQPYHRVLARGRQTGATMPLHYHLYILLQLLEGLHYAHGVTDFDGTPLSLVHRDVSPPNVFLTYDGHVKVLDFGIAKALNSSTDTHTGMLKGKIAYMSPEQAAGEPLDRRADVFSVGVMLWEIVVGRRMWDRQVNDMQILHALMTAAIPRPRDAAPDIDPTVERIILKATSMDARGRYASASEMQGELEGYLKGLNAPSFGARDVGKLVSHLFTNERAQIKSALDSQLRMLRGTATSEYRRIDMAKLSSPPEGHSTEVSLAAVKTGSRSTSGQLAAKERRRRAGIAAASLFTGVVVSTGASLYGGHRAGSPESIANSAQAAPVQSTAGTITAPTPVVPSASSPDTAWTASTDTAQTPAKNPASTAPQRPSWSRRPGAPPTPVPTAATTTAAKPAPPPASSPEVFDTLVSNPSATSSKRHIDTDFPGKEAH